MLASDAVVHFGAAVSVGQSMYQVDRYVDVNTRGTALLLDILVNAKHNVAEGARGLLDWRLRRRGVPLCRLRAGGARDPVAEQLAARDWEQRCPSCGRTSCRCRRLKTRRSTATTSTR